MKKNKKERQKRFVAVCAIVIVLALLAGIFLPAFVQVASAKTTAELKKEVEQAKQNKSSAKAPDGTRNSHKHKPEEEIISIPCFFVPGETVAPV